MVEKEEIIYKVEIKDGNNLITIMVDGENNSKEEIMEATKDGEINNNLILDGKINNQTMVGEVIKVEMVDGEVIKVEIVDGEVIKVEILDGDKIKEIKELLNLDIKEQWVLIQWQLHLEIILVE